MFSFSQSHKISFALFAFFLLSPCLRFLTQVASLLFFSFPRLWFLFFTSIFDHKDTDEYQLWL